jgi:hypothetical protein
MRSRVVILAAACLLLIPARDATADITAFIGITPSPENRVNRGFAFGFGLVIVGFEFEYGNTIEDTAANAPSLRTGSGNVLVQTPVEIAGTQFYGTIGGGIYRERLLTRQETHFESNVGGGAKIRLLGPLRLRLDYRVFRLRGDPLNQTYQRFYAGANIAF